MPRTEGPPSDSLKSRIVAVAPPARDITIDSPHPDSILNDPRFTFDEVPARLLQRADWSVVWSAPWIFAQNILHTEARALVWSFRHKLRSLQSFARKHLALVDNLPLALAATKGRARSHHLLRPLRCICAL